MSKYTSGKWIVRSTGCVGTNQQLVAVVYPMEETAPDEHEANTRLIAAAPDLLEACEIFAEWLCREENGFTTVGNNRDTPEGERAWRDWYDENLSLCALAQKKARSAIAKATGEQS